MRMMVLAGLAILASAPVLAAGGEIPFHVSAQGMARPDGAILKFDIKAQGDDRAAAETALAQEDKRIRDELVKAGADPKNIALGKSTEDYPAESATLDDMVDEATGVAEAVAEAAGEEPKKIRKKKRKGDETFAATPVVPFGLRAQMTVTLDDLSKLDAIRKIANPDDDLFTAKPDYTVKDPQKQRQRAIADAVAKARGDADSYAAALGYRVVRVTKMSTDAQGINFSINSAMQFVTLFGQNRGDEQMLLKSGFAAVEIDYMLAPK